MRRMAGLVVALVVAPLLAGRLGAFSGAAPADLGVTDGRLQPPSATRNSVSSQADLHPDHPQRADARIDPLPFKPAGAEASLVALQAALRAQPGIVVVRSEPGYVRAEATTRWLRFVDDLEFWVNAPRGVIELRSASRLGREDFGTNRERIEAIRAAYLALP